MIRTFLIGNGESRKDFDLNVLKPYGQIYGCNAIYRDYPDLCDVICAVDGGMIHEIYHSGMCQKIPCYFRAWTKIPTPMYRNVIEGMATGQDLKEMKDFDIIRQNEKGESAEFATHGSTISGAVTILKKAKDEYGTRVTTGKRETKNIHNAHIYISWIKEPDKSFDIKECGEGGEDEGWATGPSSGYVATMRERPCEIYMIGHDLISDTKTINNIYKSTDNYVTTEYEPTPSGNWEIQWRELMENNPKIHFFKVNKELDNKPTNQKVDRFRNQEGVNLEYISQAQLLDRMSKW